MKTHLNAQNSECISMQVNAETKEFLSIAARLLGYSDLSSFILDSAQREAQNLFEENKPRVLSDRDRDLVLNLNNYIVHYASQQQGRYLTTVHIATNRSTLYPKPIYGFYTLCTSEICFESLPKQLCKNIPNNYTIPSIKIGRLARDINRTSNGF